MLTFGLTIVRHGETQYNKDALLQGQALDPPLSEVGVRQAEAAGRYLGNLAFTNVFVSNMLRAHQTAEIIIQNNSRCSGLELVCDPLLRERSFGVAEGHPVDYLRNMAKAAGQTCPDFTPPEGETQEQVKQRFKAFLERMLRRMVADHCGEGRGQEEGAEPEPEAGAGPAGGQQPGGGADEGLAGLGARGAHALLVGHGAYIRVALRHLVEELGCSLPPGADMGTVTSLCPNTGVCRLLVTLGGRGDVDALRCVFLHRVDHMKDGL